MPTLKVKDFSCIKSACLEQTPLTLIIGPQASGKSVICKLLYFCNTVTSDLVRLLVQASLDFEALTKHLSAQFCEWFPASAWGERRFTIEYSTEQFSLKISRIATSDKVRITFSESYINFYKHHVEQVRKLTASRTSDLEEEDNIFEIEFRAQQLIIENAGKWLGKDMIFNQQFIPAGRSFFTSIGKALIAFEHSGILDPLTLSFGRRFASIREYHSRRGPGRNQLMADIFSGLLGGTPKSEGGKDYLQAVDGRLIPFSALSSGQQELLPLAMTLLTMLATSPNKAANQRAARRTVYIEEPEAHLFPKAQSDLVEILSSLITKKRVKNLVITTHSPYVLSKFNNLIRAGQISKSTKKHKDLEKIIPEAAWIPSRSAVAYAIIDNKLQCITDYDGLIAADYLDDVSSDIIDEFSELLNLEREA